MPYLVPMPSYVPAAGHAMTKLHLHKPRRRRGLHRKKHAYRCDWCGQVCGREGCTTRLDRLAAWEAATPPSARIQAAREDRYLFSGTEAQEILSLAQAEAKPVGIPAQRLPQPYPMPSISAAVQ
jgi:hypothetical protein